VKRTASHRASHDDLLSNDSSSQGDDFGIAPRPRRTTRKTTQRGNASSSQGDEEASNMTEGQAIRQASEERASDIIQKVEHPLWADYEYTLTRVDHHHPRRPTDFTKGENQSMINRHEDPYEWTTELHDHKFWNNFQADWYLTVIKDRKNPITQELYVDWSYIQKKRDPVFKRVIAKSQRLGIFDILDLHQEWNTELVAQFYATTWRSGEGLDSTLNFALEGHRFELKISELPTIFGLAGNHFDREPISIERSISDKELAPLYYPGNECNFGTNHGMLPEFYVFNNIFRNTLTPKRGDHTSIRGSTRNLLLAILDYQPPPCISVFFWSELMFALNHGTVYCHTPKFQNLECD
jgi:hypothetical protein